jgi:UDP-N-acetylglucosamine 2-epimerase (non-hydrolysing)
MKTLLVAAARPNFMKVAPILRALEADGAETVLVHTGQHYDANMSDAFFRDLEIRAPDHHLEVGSGSHAVQTARVMEAFEPVLLEERPDWVTVVGDVNSTLACALVASKLKEEIGCRIAHVEAGLRSRDWRMPEEVNRVLTDRLSDLLLTPSRDAHPNLLGEGVDEERIRFVGNVMIDTLHHQLEAARSARMAERLGLERDGYVVVTLHRPSNVDDPEALAGVLAALDDIAAECPSSSRCTPARVARWSDSACSRAWTRSACWSRSATGRCSRWWRAPARCSPTPAGSRRRPRRSAFPASRCASRPSGRSPSRRGPTASLPGR